MGRWSDCKKVKRYVPVMADVADEMNTLPDAELDQACTGLMAAHAAGPQRPCSSSMSMQSVSIHVHVTHVHAVCIHSCRCNPNGLAHAVHVQAVAMQSMSMLSM